MPSLVEIGKEVLEYTCMCIVSKVKTRSADKYFCDPKHSLKIKDAKKKRSWNVTI